MKIGYNANYKEIIESLRFFPLGGVMDSVVEEDHYEVVFRWANNYEYETIYTIHGTVALKDVWLELTTDSVEVAKDLSDYIDKDTELTSIKITNLETQKTITKEL